MVTIDDFKKIEMKIGKILSAQRVPDTDKLLQLSVDFNEEEPRQVISGIAEYFEDPDSLVGKRCSFVTNLEPRTIRGLESQAMILAVLSEEGVFSILEPTLGDIRPGSALS